MRVRNPAAGNIGRQLGTHRRVTLNFESSDRCPNPREDYAARFVGLVFFGGLVVYTLVILTSTCGLVAMTSASHAEGRQFDPGQVYLRVFLPRHTCHMYLAKIELATFSVLG